MGFNWRAFEKVAELVAGPILVASGVPPSLVPLVVHGIQIAEASTNGDPKTGAEKKAIAMDAVQTGLSAINSAKPGTVDTATLTDVVSSGIDVAIKAIKAGGNIPMFHTL